MSQLGVLTAVIAILFSSIGRAESRAEVSTEEFQDSSSYSSEQFQSSDRDAYRRPRVRNNTSRYLRLTKSKNPYGSRYQSWKKQGTLFFTYQTPSLRLSSQHFRQLNIGDNVCLSRLGRQECGTVSEKAAQSVTLTMKPRETRVYARSRPIRKVKRQWSESSNYRRQQTELPEEVQDIAFEEEEEGYSRDTSAIGDGELSDTYPVDPPRHVLIAPGINVGLNHVYPIVDFQIAIFKRFALGFFPLYGERTSSGSNLKTLGGFATLNFYSRSAFRGFWTQLGVGIYDFKLATSPTQRTSSPAAIATLGWREVFRPGFSVGAALGLQYLKDPKFFNHNVDFKEFQPSLVVELGWAF